MAVGDYDADGFPDLFLANFQGNLDGSGHAAANFNSLGPIDPIMIGLDFSYAYTLYNPFNMASNPVMLPVVP